MKIILITTLCLLIVVPTFAQEKPGDRVSVKFSNPAQPGWLKVHLIYGSIMVEGHDGDEVSIEARTRIPAREKARAGGMYRLVGSSTGLKVEERNNRMTVTAGSHHRTIDLTLHVPTETSLKLSTMNHGDIFVENVEGDFEIKNMNGEIKILNIAGTVIATSMNGDVVVRFREVHGKNPMTFSTMNGDVDISLPENINADVKMKAEHGDILSDFDIQLASTNLIKKETRNQGGRYHIQFDNALSGKINGGGPEYDFSTVNGNIYIRKSE